MTVAMNARGCLLASSTTTVAKRGLESTGRGSGYMTAIPDVRLHQETVVGMKTPVVTRTTGIADTTNGPDMMIADLLVMTGVILLATTETVAGEEVL